MPLESYELGPQGDTEELNPFRPDIDQHLEEFDHIYEEETGISPFLEGYGQEDNSRSGCKRDECHVWARVNRATQELTLYIGGEVSYVWDVSTGAAGHGTPKFDRHPNGRIYDKYSSSKYPGGDYKGLGNMPYAVFIEGGFAIHGTPEANWPLLGQKASHGCIRLHPDNGFIFNRLVRDNGIENVWITVE
ncbi:MAG: L,D-transpeptidase [Bdellovibrionales bacterium]|nr:L,D-transpeptidase [Bdellovibrionales bacterium]